MGYALIDEEKLDTLLKGQERLEAMLINLQPVKQEPNPREPWTAQEIADACGYNKQRILELIRDNNIPKIKNCPVTIEYRHIKELKLKNFKA